MSFNANSKSEASISNFQKVRKTFLFLWLIAMPVVFAWMSPIVIIISGLQQTINMGMIIFSVWFVSSLFLGRAYCAFACMGGAGQEIFGHLINKPLRMDSRKLWRTVRYVIFIFWLAAILFFPITKGGFIRINPFFPNELGDPMPFISLPKKISAGLFMYFGMQLLAFVILPLFWGNRAFCNYICPISILGDIGTRIRNFLCLPGLRLRSDVQKCIHCGKCNGVCQMGIDVAGLVNEKSMEDPDCIMCGECIDACPKKAIQFGWGRKISKHLANRL